MKPCAEFQLRRKKTSRGPICSSLKIVNTQGLVFNGDKNCKVSCRALREVSPSVEEVQFLQLTEWLPTYIHVRHEQGMWSTALTLDVQTASFPVETIATSPQYNNTSEYRVHLRSELNSFNINYTKD